MSALATETLRETYRLIPHPPGDESPRRALTRLVAEVEGRIVGTVQYGIREAASTSSA